MLTKELKEEADQRADWFKSKGSGMMTPMMLNECKMQFIEMAQGGDGSVAMMGNIRSNHYEGKPDEFFQHVCNVLGWRF